MSIAQYSKMESTDILTLKTNVDNELKRRCRSGSVADKVVSYTTQPNVGTKVLIDHVNNLLTEINTILDFKYDNKTSVQSGQKAYSIDSFQTKITALAAEPMKYRGTSSCRSGCTGLCVSTCWDACIGCTGCTGCTSCSGCGGCGGCGGTCSGSCYNTCSTCSYECASSSTCTCGYGCEGCTGCGNTCYGSN